MILFLITVSIFIPVSYGIMNLELTSGVVIAIPIAVMPFTNCQVMATGNQTLSEIIKNDLKNSGQFFVLDPNNLHHSSISFQQINYSYWREKINALVIGVVQPLRMQRYRVTFALVNIFDSNNLLLSESFNANSQALRNVAHHISNLIYQKLTGVRGIFSTKIIYVLVSSSKERTKIKYTLEITDADGYNSQTLLASCMPIMSPTWSPDGKKIAYVSFEKHHATIYLQDLATGQRKRISDAPGINGAPAFSPDGSRLSFVLSRTGTPRIYILNLADKQLCEITKGWAIDTEPAWSPDGKSLLFTSNRDGTPQIYQYSFKSGTVNRITYQGDYNARASFMPDGKSIIMMHQENGLFGIARQNLTTGEIQILNASGTDESPSVSPNGKMVIYVMKCGNHNVLEQVSTNGQIKLRFPIESGDAQEPAWGPIVRKELKHF